MHVAFATDAESLSLTPDDRIAAAHLERHGARVTPARWDDDAVDWSSFDAVVIRSCWDYHLRPDDFGAWLDRLEAAGCRVENPVPTLRWNRHKGYLEELRDAGFEVVPTVFLARGARAQLTELMDRLGCDELVLKPPVGASAYGLWSARRDEAGEAQGRLDAALRDGELMVQPRLREIETGGEWSLAFFGGGFSHAVVKRPKAGDFRVQEELGGRSVPAPPPAALRAAADALLDWLASEGPADAPPVYARVDLVDVAGQATLMELELIEPWLYFHTDPASPERFRRALARAG